MFHIYWLRLNNTVYFDSNLKYIHTHIVEKLKAWDTRMWINNSSNESKLNRYFIFQMEAWSFIYQPSGGLTQRLNLQYWWLLRLFTICITNITIYDQHLNKCINLLIKYVGINYEFYFFPIVPTHLFVF